MAGGSTSFTARINVVTNVGDAVNNIKSIQNALNGIKLPDSIKTSLGEKFKSFYKEAEKYQDMLARGPKTKGDASALERSGEKVLKIYESISKEINSIDNKTLKNAFKDMGGAEVERLKGQLEQVKTSLSNMAKESNFGKGLEDSFKQASAAVADLKDGAAGLMSKLKGSTFKTFTKNLTDGRLDLAAKNLESIKEQINNLEDGAGKKELLNWIQQVETGFNGLKDNQGVQSLLQQMNELKGQLSGAAAQAVEKLIQDFTQMASATDGSTEALRRWIQEQTQAGKGAAQLNTELAQVKNRITYFLGLANAVNLFKRAIRSAFNTVKELDKVMTETAVVTNFSVSDMWKQLPEYTKRANELGVTTKAAYESATLYYQQGLNTNQVAAVSVETLKMARIAGLDAAEATDRMTNALRGFNMEINATSAQKVDDVYSKLAAITASNVDEISTAMTKVASLASNANMDFETTSAFLAKIIETTRESAETAGTALKTVIARFSEVKNLYSEDQLKGTDEEGQAIDVNKISKALRTAGIDLNKYFLGEVGLDDIFMELAEKWDSLTNVQQRYIATQAAGSRQQSRFIALMQDYARTQELVTAAYNSNGASAKQFEKTQESIESKLARLKNAWDEFLMGIANSTVIKGVVDLLTGLLNVLNKLTGAFGPTIGGFLKLATAIGALAGVKKLINSKGFANILGKIGDSNLGKFFGWKNPLGNSDASKTAKTSWIKAAKQVVTAWIKGEKEVTAASIKGEEEEKSAAIAGETKEAGAATAGEQEETATAVIGEQEETSAAIIGEQEETSAAVAGEAKEATAAVVGEAKEATAAVAGEEEEATAAIAGEAGEAVTGAAGEIGEAVAGAMVTGGGTAVIQGVTTAAKTAKTAADTAITAATAAETAVTAAGFTGPAAVGAAYTSTGALAVSGQTAGILASFGSGGAAAAGSGAAAGGLSAAAATGIGAIIIAVVALITAAVYDQYKKSAAGQLKTAQKMNDSLEKINQETQNTTKDTSDKIEQYNSLTEDVDKAKDVREKRKAIAKRNDFVNQMLQEDQRYSQYSKTKYDKNGDLILTLDDDFVKNYDQFAEQAKNTAQVNNDLASAVLAQKQINKYDKDFQDYNIDLANKTRYLGKQTLYNQATKDVYADLSEEEVAKYTQMAVDRDEQKRIYEESTKTAFQGMLKNSGLNEDLSELTAEALAKNFDADEFYDKVDKKQTENWWAGKATVDELRKAYKELYGVDADRSLSREELRDAVSYAQVQQEEQQKADNFSKLIESNENYGSLLKLYNGQFDNDVSQFKTEDIYNNLIKGTNLAEDELELFAKTLGIDTEKLKETIQANIELQKKIEQQKIGKLTILGKKQGVDNNKIANLVANLNTKQIDQLLGISDKAQTLLKDNFKDFLENEELFNAENFDKTIELFNSMNLDNPIQSLSKLKEAANGTNATIRDLANSIIDINKNTLFDTGNLTQTFMMSSAYEGISESLQDFIEENEEITSDNIIELAKNCKELDLLIKNATDDSINMEQALARAFTVVESGKANIEGITTAVLKALGNTNTSNTAIDKYFKTIEDFDAGRDYDKGKEFINTGLESLKKTLENLDFGSETFKNYYKELFGADELKAFQGYSLDKKKTELQVKTDRLTKLIENDALEAVRELVNSGQITGLKSINSENTEFEWETDMTFDEAVAAIQKELSVGESTAAAILLQMGKHMDGLFDQFDANAYQDDIKALADSLKEEKILTEEELKALAAAYGKTVEQIYEDLRTQFGELEGFELPVQVKWYNEDGTLLEGKDLTDKFTFERKTGEVTIIDASGQSQKFVDTNLQNYFHQESFEDWAGRNYGQTWDSRDMQFQRQIRNEYNSSIHTQEVNPDEILSYLQSTYKLSQAQATEVANSIVQSNNGVFSKTVERPKIENGEYTIEKITLTDSSIEGLNKQIQAEEKQADWEGMAAAIGASVANALEGLNFTPEANVPSQQNIDEVKKAVSTELSKTTFTPIMNSPVTNSSNSSNSSNSIYNSDIDQRPSHQRGRAKGGNELHLGTALVGEEGPELVWNKEGGYTYLAGKSGPEFRQLNPGDQIFPADETKLILNRNIHPALANGGKILPSYDGGGAIGGWNPPEGTSTDSNHDTATKLNELDKYYNLVEDINELLRIRDKLENEYKLMLESENVTGAEIYNNLKQQLKILEERKKLVKQLADYRLQEIHDTMAAQENADLGQYVWWNDEDQTLEIDWGKINAIKDEDLYKRITDYLKKLEGLQDSFDKYKDELQNIEQQLQEIQKRGRDKYQSLEDRVRDALMQEIKDKIDELTAANQGINTANQNLLQSIQSTLDKQRQERENAKTEKELADKEEKLQYLLQDSSNANALEIANLQKELDDERQSYTDSLIDQKISELQKQNDEASEQRQEQIDLMQQSLDWQEKSGAFWDQVYAIIDDGMGHDGTLVKGSQLEDLLKKGEGWDKLSDEGKMKWLSELESSMAEAAAYLAMSRQLEDIGTKAGSKITFTNANGQTLTGTVDKNGNVVVKNADGTETTYKNVFQDYNGSYRTFETEEQAETPEKPATSTQQPQTGGSTQPENEYEYKYFYVNDTTCERRRRKKGTSKWSTVWSGSHTTIKPGTTCNNCKHTFPKRSSGGGSGGGCFVAGTKITMADNTYKSIENVVVGDYVVAYNDKNNQFESRKVIKSYAHYNTPRVINIYLSNGIVLGITPGHPILTTDGWKSRDINNSLYEHGVEATWLNIGDVVISYIGKAIVINIQEVNIPNNYITYNIEVEICHTYVADEIVVHNGKQDVMMAYATGGLNTKTGPAWLDGTPSRPELVLNARDTENFIQLKDTLVDLRKNPINLSGASGDNYYDIDVHVDEIGSDYDVDRLADRLKTLIYKDGQYRNVNVLNRLR